MNGNTSARKSAKASVFLCLHVFDMYLIRYKNTMNNSTLQLLRSLGSYRSQFTQGLNEVR